MAVEAGQVEVGELPNRLWDAVVVGAGPAGSACAAALAAAGHSVALLDGAPFPRPKVCGGGLIADALAALDRLGLLPEVRAAALGLRELSLFSPSRVEVRARGDYLALGRAELDALLARGALRRGASFARARVTRVTVEPGGTAAVEVTGRAALRGRVAVLAIGAHLGLAADLGMATPASLPPDAVAVCRRVRSRARLDRLVASFDRAVLPGYAWVFPHAEGAFSIGCGVFHRAARGGLPNLAATLDAFVREFPVAREVMAQAIEVGPLEGAPLRCGLRGASLLGPGPVVAVGEAVGATFPFTGEGIGKALETGELAARALHEALATGDLGALRGYPDAVERELRPKYWGYEIAEAWIRWPGLIDFLARRVLRSRHLQRAASGILRETTDPRAIFSLAGIARSLLP